MQHLLAGDIGGTKTLLRLSTTEDKHILLQKTYPSTGYPGLAEMLEEFLREAGTANISTACFAVAGPVFGRHAQLTNLPWDVDADALQARFAIPDVQIINDFEAVGRGIAALQAEDLITLQFGEAEPQGTRLVVGAGTGLGVAWLAWQGNQYTVHASEGGHMDFAPLNDMQYDLLRYLQQRHGHVSYERIVSGPGLVAIHDFLCDSGRGEPSAQLVSAMAAGDAAAAITQAAQLGGEPSASMTLELFIHIYGAYIGNLALLMLPRGGIYVAGGIAAKIIMLLQHGDFVRSFRDKGRYAGMLETLPLHVVSNSQVGLLGAELYAHEWCVSKDTARQ